MPRLIDGVPSSGAVALHGWVYYTFHNMFGTKRDMHVTLTSATGNADLYVTLGTSAKAACARLCALFFVCTTLCALLCVLYFVCSPSNLITRVGLPLGKFSSVGGGS
jgi:predicted secreted protein